MIFLAFFMCEDGRVNIPKMSRRFKRPELNVDMLTDDAVCFGAEISWNFVFSFTLNATLVPFRLFCFFHFFLQENIQTS
jgi:hypothetical protein